VNAENTNETLGQGAGFATSAPELPGWRHVYSGKVRDLYEPVGDGPAETVLVVASDRIQVTAGSGLQQHAEG
jgi:phosphoribosylaminoimidazole-succinocarboxamide synthase